MQYNAHNELVRGASGNNQEPTMPDSVPRFVKNKSREMIRKCRLTAARWPWPGTFPACDYRIGPMTYGLISTALFAAIVTVGWAITAKLTMIYVLW